MAELKGGLFKGMSGRVGELIIYQLNGKTIARSRPGEYHDRKTPAQMSQRQKMVLVNDFLRPFLKVLSRTFEPRDKERKGFHAAKSYNLRNGIKGVYPEQQIDFSRALICKGDILLPTDIKAELRANILEVSWTAELGQDPLDRAVIIVRHVNDYAGEVVFTDVARREGKCSVDFSYNMSDGYVFWIAFRSIDETDISNNSLLDI